MVNQICIAVDDRATVDAIQRALTRTHSLPKYIKRDQLASMFRMSSHNPSPVGYTSVVIRVRSRSAAEAVKIALEELDYVRGIWNFGNNLGVINRGGGREPINRIRVGQVHAWISRLF
jgi:hypothetical protein